MGAMFHFHKKKDHGLLHALHVHQVVQAARQSESEDMPAKINFYIPVMCSSGPSAVTAPMALTAGAAGVGVGSAVNKLNDVIAMIAEVKSIADSLNMSNSYPLEDVKTVQL